MRYYPKKEHYALINAAPTNELVIPEKLSIERKRRYAYVKKLAALEYAGRTRKTLLTVIAEVSDEINDLNSPSWQTLRRWHQQFKTAGNSSLSLIPNHNLKGNRNSKVSGQQLKNVTEHDLTKSQEVEVIINRNFEEKFLCYSITAQSLLTSINLEIDEVNKHRSETFKLPKPHINSIFRRMRKFPKEKIILVRLVNFCARNRNTKPELQIQVNQSTNPVGSKNKQLKYKVRENTRKLIEKRKSAPSKLKKIVRFFQERQAAESCIYLCKHQKILEEQRIGIKKRSLLDLATLSDHFSLR